MKFTWINEIQDVSWKELSNLYRIAPLGEKHPKDLEKVFTNSMYTYFIYDKDRLIGAGRALADGVDCSYLCDVAVHPDYQGKGLGKELIFKLIEASKSHKKILLYSGTGKRSILCKVRF